MKIINTLLTNIIDAYAAQQNQSGNAIELGAQFEILRKFYYIYMVNIELQWRKCGDFAKPKLRPATNWDIR